MQSNRVGNGNEDMTSSSSIYLRARDCRIAIRHDMLRLTLRFRERLREIDVVRNPLIAHVAVGSQDEPGCSPEHAL
jgi:hypothetical protein